MSGGSAPICAASPPIECLMPASGFSDVETARSSETSDRISGKEDVEFLIRE
jgi:hypothetical protein